MNFFVALIIDMINITHITERIQRVIIKLLLIIFHWLKPYYYISSFAIIMKLFCFQHDYKYGILQIAVFQSFNISISNYKSGAHKHQEKR